MRSLVLLLLLGFSTAFMPRVPPSSTAPKPQYGIQQRPRGKLPGPSMKRLMSAGTAEPELADEVTERVITVTGPAIDHLKDLKSKQGVDHLWLRMGVRSGGCSGMSYILDVMKAEEITEEDHLESYDQHGFTCVVDPKSMLYLFGLNLDYSDALIGGGFSFQNPNSQESCGCGKSFNV